MSPSIRPLAHNSLFATYRRLFLFTSVGLGAVKFLVFGNFVSSWLCSNRSQQLRVYEVTYVWLDVSFRQLHRALISPRMRTYTANRLLTYWPTPALSSLGAYAPTRLYRDLPYVAHTFKSTQNILIYIRFCKSTSSVLQ